MPEIDSELTRHCLGNLPTASSPQCPVLRERNLAMTDGICDGRSPSDQLFEFLVQAIRAKDEADKGKERARLQGQIEALSYSVALIRNPYRPDPETVLLLAERESDL